jgi:hypothetical protein
MTPRCGRRPCWQSQWQSKSPACRDHWLGLRWLTALAADLVVVALTEYFLRPAGTSDVLTPIHPGTVLGAQIALLTIYLASNVDRTIFRGLNVTWFEIGQATVAFLIAIGGALRVAGSAPVATLGVGPFCLLGGVACYMVSFAFLDRKHGRDRNFYTYSTFGMLLRTFCARPTISGAPPSANTTYNGIRYATAGADVAYRKTRCSAMPVTAIAVIRDAVKYSTCPFHWSTRSQQGMAIRE